jgi:adenylate cyclase
VAAFVPHSKTSRHLTYVLEGSVRKSGDRLRISVQLVEAATGNHLWAEKYDGAVEDVFDLQDQIAEGVVSAIEPSIRRAEIERARRKRPENLDAYDLYLEALPHAWAFSPEENAKALPLLDEALRLDPGRNGRFKPILNLPPHACGSWPVTCVLLK